MLISIPLWPWWQLIINGKVSHCILAVFRQELRKCTTAQKNLLYPRTVIPPRNLASPWMSPVCYHFQTEQINTIFVELLFLIFYCSARIKLCLKIKSTGPNKEFVILFQATPFPTPAELVWNGRKLDDRKRNSTLNKIMMENNFLIDEKFTFDMRTWES